MKHTIRDIFKSLISLLVILYFHMTIIPLGFLVYNLTGDRRFKITRLEYIALWSLAIPERFLYDDNI